MLTCDISHGHRLTIFDRAIIPLSKINTYQPSDFAYLLTKKKGRWFILHLLRLVYFTLIKTSSQLNVHVHVTLLTYDKLIEISTHSSFTTKLHDTYLCERNKYITNVSLSHKKIFQYHVYVKENKHTESIAKSNTGPPPAPTNSDLQPLFRRTFS